MTRVALLFTMSAVAFTASCAEAQVDSTRSALGAINRGFRTATQQTLRRPTVSPYLQLVQGNGGGVNAGFGNAVAIYQTQVRPAVEREQQQLLQQRQIQQMQSQLNEVRSTYRQQNSGYFSTGHPTRFMSYSHYYPLLGGR